MKVVRFVASDPERGGLPVKRKQVPTACSSCRKKKKRCVHQEAGLESLAEAESESTSFLTTTTTRTTSTSTPTPTPTPTPTSTTTTTPTQLRLEPSTAAPPPLPLPAAKPISPTARFVGDSNPEGMFVEAADIARSPDADPAATAATAAAAQNGHLGIWLSGSACSGVGSVTRASHSIPLVQRLLLSVLDAECLACVPPRHDYVRLRETFVAKIHPVFPVFPLSSLFDDDDDDDDNSDNSDDAAVLVRQLVSLAASADPHMAPYLHLKSTNPPPAPPLPAAEFAASVASAVRALLETDRVADRVLRIRAHLLLSLYLQPSGPAQADLPSQLAARAVHDVHTLGMQVMRYDEGEGGEELETLFCLAWAADRLNAAMYGRPVMMHERDVGSDLEACIRRREPCFRLLLMVVQWLDQVIGLYRAGVPPPAAPAAPRFIDLPVLEAMIVEADALRVPAPLIGTVEALYHAVIILSCRLSRPTTHATRDGAPPPPPPPPPPSANARRSLAAERIATAVSSPRERPSPVPFVPYAVSLALSVEYRKMRHSRLPMFRARARDAFARHCELLSSFGDFFWAARVVAGLGSRMLREMERAAGARALEELAGGGRAAQAGQAGPGGGGGERSRGEGTSDGVGDGGRSRRSNGETGSSGLAREAASSTSMQGDDRSRDGSGQGGSCAGIGMDGTGDEGVFGHFDPSFDLAAVDSAIEANLDISLPLNWVDWDSFLQ